MMHTRKSTCMYITRLNLCPDVTLELNIGLLELFIQHGINVAADQ